MPALTSIGDTDQAFTDAHTAIDPLRAITPGSGAHQNEADVFETDRAESFWGKDNYERLLRIKRDVDPTNIFTCWNCVGRDSSDKRYSCYPKLLT
jgi:FAD/FMN-containing dehydrogenase